MKRFFGYYRIRKADVREIITFVNALYPRNRDDDFFRLKISAGDSELLKELFHEN